MKQTTLIFLIRKASILLALKKRGFGQGKYNGCGGKLKPGENLKQGALRELAEEVGIKSDKKDLKPAGWLKFFFSNKPQNNQKVYLYLTNSWRGTPKESGEMKPRWFKFKNIPYKLMWPDDRYWLPLVLKGKTVKGEFHFNLDASGFTKILLRIF